MVTVLLMAAIPAIGIFVYGIRKVDQCISTARGSKRYYG